MAGARAGRVGMFGSTEHLPDLPVDGSDELEFSSGWVFHRARWWWVWAGAVWEEPSTLVGVPGLLVGRVR